MFLDEVSIICLHKFKRSWDKELPLSNPHQFFKTFSIFFAFSSQVLCSFPGITDSRFTHAGMEIFLIKTQEVGFSFYFITFPKQPVSPHQGHHFQMKLSKRWRKCEHLWSQTNVLYHLSLTLWEILFSEILPILYEVFSISLSFQKIWSKPLHLPKSRSPSCILLAN